MGDNFTLIAVSAIVIVVISFCVVLLSVAIAIYFFVLGREKAKQNQQLRNRVIDLTKELREWHNKFLQERGHTPLFTEPYEIDPEKVNRPGPRIVLRQELQQRDHENRVAQGEERAEGAKNVRPARSPAPKEGRQPAPVRVVVDKAKEIIDATK